MKDKFKINTSFSTGIDTDLKLQVNHKVYYPYYFDLNWTHSDFEIDSTYGISQRVQVWNEARAGLNFKILDKLDLGVEAALKKATWENNDGDIYKLTSFGEINATYDILQKKNARVGVMAFGKIFQIEEPTRGYTQLIGGLRAQIGIKMFQGFSEAFLNITLISKPVNPNFFIDYTEWWSIGFKVFIPN